MKFFRGSIVVAVFFALISLGQGYSLAYVFAKASQAAHCGCNQSGRECLHGCELKNRVSKSHGCHGKKVTAWVNPNCSKKNETPALSFQSDPFLPQKNLLTFATHYFSSDLTVVFFAQHWFPATESPPPKSV